MANHETFIPKLSIELLADLPRVGEGEEERQAAAQKRTPTIPASMHAIMERRSIHLIFDMECMSTEMIMRVSLGGHTTACVTEVPPPKGIRTTLCSEAARTSFSQSS